MLSLLNDEIGLSLKFKTIFLVFDFKKLNKSKSTKLIFWTTIPILVLFTYGYVNNWKFEYSYQERTLLKKSNHISF